MPQLGFFPSSLCHGWDLNPRQSESCTSLRDLWKDALPTELPRPLHQGTHIEINLTVLPGLRRGSKMQFGGKLSLFAKSRWKMIQWQNNVGLALSRRTKVKPENRKVQKSGAGFADFKLALDWFSLICSLGQKFHLFWSEENISSAWTKLEKSVFICSSENSLNSFVS